MEQSHECYLRIYSYLKFSRRILQVNLDGQNVIIKDYEFSVITFGKLKYGPIIFVPKINFLQLFAVIRYGHNNVANAV